MKGAALAALLFSALLGSHALADTGPTNPNPSTPGMGMPPEIPAPGSTDPRMQGSDPGRQGGASTDGTDRSRPETLDDDGTGRGNERDGQRMGSGSGTGTGTRSSDGQ